MANGSQPAYEGDEGYAPDGLQLFFIIVQTPRNETRVITFIAGCLCDNGGTCDLDLFINTLF